jgi:hypothetical protein
MLCGIAGSECREQIEPEGSLVFVIPGGREDHPTIVSQMIDPSTQKRRLAASRGRRDQRDALFDGLVESAEKALAVDQPG